MVIRRPWRAVAGATLAAACAPAEPPAAAAPGQDERGLRPGTEELFPCNSSLAQALVGRIADPATRAEALRLAGASTLRLVRPGEPLASDYVTDRLTVELDESNRILRLYCS